MHMHMPMHMHMHMHMHIRVLCCPGLLQLERSAEPASSHEGHEGFEPAALVQQLSSCLAPHVEGLRRIFKLYSSSGTAKGGRELSATQARACAMYMGMGNVYVHVHGQGQCVCACAWAMCMGNVHVHVQCACGWAMCMCMCNVHVQNRVFITKGHTTLAGHVTSI